MAYDDTPYWMQNNPVPDNNKAADAPKFPVIKRSVPLACDVLAAVERSPRAKFVSPLLAEWLAENPDRNVGQVKLPDGLMKKKEQSTTGD